MIKSLSHPNRKPRLAQRLPSSTRTLRYLLHSLHESKNKKKKLHFRFHLQGMLYFFFRLMISAVYFVNDSSVNLSHVAAHQEARKGEKDTYIKNKSIYVRTSNSHLSQIFFIPHAFSYHENICMRQRNCGGKSFEWIEVNFASLFQRRECEKCLWWENLPRSAVHVTWLNNKVNILLRSIPSSHVLHCLKFNYSS